MVVTKKYVGGLGLKLRELIDVRGSAGPNSPHYPEFFPLRSQGNYLGLDQTHLIIQDCYSKTIRIPFTEIQAINSLERKVQL